MTKLLPFSEEYFDTVISLFSLGCLKNDNELNKAIINIKKILKPGGKLLHINTDGKNSNDILPAYTRNGLSQSPTQMKETLKKHGFTKITIKRVKLKADLHGPYKYNSISLLSATK